MLLINPLIPAPTPITILYNAENTPLKAVTRPATTLAVALTRARPLVNANNTTTTVVTVLKNCWKSSTVILIFEINSFNGRNESNNAT